jgi:hypothetical protein
MTTDEQIIAIAKVCGWRKGDFRASWCHPDNWSAAKNGAYGVWVSQDKLPNYPSDLNACHEMEKMLNYEQAELFEDSLCDIAKSANDVLENPLQSKSFIFHATAAQRAEAFLRTLGLWTTTPTQPQ